MSDEHLLARPRTIRSQVAHAALLDVGRPDPARRVGTNRVGDCSFVGGVDSVPMTDRRLVHRAFLLGHRADPEGRPHDLASVNEWPFVAGEVDRAQ